MNITRRQSKSLLERVPKPVLRVLVVDDEPSILFAYQKLLGAEGFTVDACGELEAALHFTNSCSYFAVITDIRLSGSGNSDGVALLRAVRSQQPLAKTVVVTGYGTSELERTLKELGATHYFEKPVRPSLILDILNAVNAVPGKQSDVDNS
jgi:DNA-binding NtrC family response regulator